MPSLHRPTRSVTSLLLVTMIGAFPFFDTLVSAAPSDDAIIAPCPATAARLILLHSGAVTLNGVEVGIDKLGLALAALKPRPSEVCYTQENSGDQSPNLGSALEVLIFAKMPISVYTDVNFSRRIARMGGAGPN
jgi:hypothetical protein